MANEVRLIDANELIEIAEQQGHVTIDDILDVPAIDPKSLRPNGHWNIRCDYYDDDMLRDADESFYLECSACKRKVWDINQLAAMDGKYRELIEQYPYCHCGCKMEG